MRHGRSSGVDVATYFGTALMNDGTRRLLVKLAGGVPRQPRPADARRGDNESRRHRAGNGARYIERLNATYVFCLHSGRRLAFLPAHLDTTAREAEYARLLAAD